MLPELHYRAYQDFLTLLTKFNHFLTSSDVDMVKNDIRQRFEDLQTFFAAHITSLSSEGLPAEIMSRWQSVQTEIKRGFKLLLTEIMFLTSARQKDTKIQKIKSINGYTTKLINYCQIMLQKHEE